MARVVVRELQGAGLHGVVTGQGVMDIIKCSGYYHSMLGHSVAESDLYWVCTSHLSHKPRGAGAGAGVAARL